MDSRGWVRQKVYAEVFKALAHPVRLSIVHELAEGEACVCDLKRKIGVDMPTISKHLSILKKAGLVSNDKRGLWVFYKLENPKVMRVLDLVVNLTRISARRKLGLMSG